MRGVRPAEIDAHVRELNANYEQRQLPLYDRRRGRWLSAHACERSTTDCATSFTAERRQARLSQAAIEVLAAVAYHEPVTAEEINKLRGTESGHMLAQLVRRQLLRLERSDGKPRRPMYWTTATISGAVRAGEPGRFAAQPVNLTSRRRAR